MVSATNMVILLVSAPLIVHPTLSAISRVAAMIRSTVGSSSPARYPAGDTSSSIFVPVSTFSLGRGSFLGFFLRFLAASSASSAVFFKSSLKNV